jgi:hypothetical protein
VLASDGIWEYLSSQRVVDLVGSVLDEHAAMSSHAGSIHHSSSSSSSSPAEDCSQAGTSGRLALPVKPALEQMQPGQGYAVRRSAGKLRAALRNMGFGGRARGRSKYGPSPASVGSGSGGSSMEQEGGEMSAAMAACTALIAEAKEEWVREHRGTYVDDITAVVLVRTSPGTASPGHPHIPC